MLAHGYDVPDVSRERSDGAVKGAGHVDGCLVGLDAAQQVVLLDRIAGPNEPFDNLSVPQALAGLSLGWGSW